MSHDFLPVQNLSKFPRSVEDGVVLRNQTLGSLDEGKAAENLVVAKQCRGRGSMLVLYKVNCWECARLEALRRQMMTLQTLWRKDLISLTLRKSSVSTTHYKDHSRFMSRRCRRICSSEKQNSTRVNDCTTVHLVNQDEVLFHSSLKSHALFLVTTFLVRTLLPKETCVALRSFDFDTVSHFAKTQKQCCRWCSMTWTNLRKRRRSCGPLVFSSEYDNTIGADIRSSIKWQKT